MSTTNVENNPGPASIIIVSGEKNLEVACSMIMGEEDVLKNPLNITNAEIHTCELDEEKGIANRKYNGKVEKASLATLKRARNDRRVQGRKVAKTQEVGMDR